MRVNDIFAIENGEHIRILLQRGTMLCRQLSALSDAVLAVGT